MTPLSDPEQSASRTKAAGQIYSEQGDNYDTDLIADLDAKAARWKSKPWGQLLAEAAARLRALTRVED